MPSNRLSICLAQLSGRFGMAIFASGDPLATLRGLAPPAIARTPPPSSTSCRGVRAGPGRSLVVCAGRSWPGSPRPRWESAPVSLRPRRRSAPIRGIHAGDGESVPIALLAKSEEEVPLTVTKAQALWWRTDGSSVSVPSFSSLPFMSCRSRAGGQLLHRSNELNTTLQRAATAHSGPRLLRWRRSDRAGGHVWEEEGSG